MKSTRSDRYVHNLWKEISRLNDYALPDDAKRFYYSIVKLISIYLAKEGKIRLPHFGTFQLKRTKGRRMREVNEGTMIHIPEKITMTFTPSAKLKDHFRRLDDEGRLEI